MDSTCANYCVVHVSIDVFESLQFTLIPTGGSTCRAVAALAPNGFQHKEDTGMLHCWRSSS
uniref:Uncharacterized protein n=1 Tax=Triticum urartu TaxID=4572 RepID=A0A8R7V5W4_TRIUA